VIVQSLLVRQAHGELQCADLLRKHRIGICMSATNFKTENSTYRKLIGNGLSYRIPRFQRDYSWTDEEWDDLWNDVLGAIGPGGEPSHYMGYLVLQSQDDKSFDVIDGQQRLTTLSLIALAVMKNLQRLIDALHNPEQNRQRVEQIRQTYIGYLDPITLTTRSKLTLNRNSDHYYQTYMVPLQKTLPVRGFRASEHALRKAFEWFNSRVQTFTNQAAGDPGVALATLLETMSDRLFFTAINVTNELNAYKVFETLNARGVKLSATDLLKNYLFSVLSKSTQHEQEMSQLEDRWEKIVSRLGAEGFPDFLRTHWLARRSFVRQADLFKAIRYKVTDRGGVFELLRDIEEDVDTYLALTNPEASHWPEALKQCALELKMFRVRQPFALLLTARRRLSDNDFATLLSTCVVISFRYNVIGNLPTHEQERAYFDTAQALHHAERAPNLQPVFENLRSIYTGDEAFKSAFAEKVIRTTDARNNRIVRYLLCRIEKQISGVDHDFQSESFNIEHVLPQNPEQGWDAFTDEEIEAFQYRIGNMTLLAKGQNKALGNSSYERKRGVLQASGFQTTKQLGDENSEWTPGKIRARQKQLANIASGIWRVSQLPN
jgi:hypothetical protein